MISAAPPNLLDLLKPRTPNPLHFLVGNRAMAKNMETPVLLGLDSGHYKDPVLHSLFKHR